MSRNELRTCQEEDDGTELLPLAANAEADENVTLPEPSGAQAHASEHCITLLLSKKVDLGTLSQSSKQKLKFAQNQNDLIDELVSLHEHRASEESDEAPAKCGVFKTSTQAATWSLLANVCLLILKLVAAVLSQGSLSIIATLVESSIDLFAGSVFFIISRRMKRREVEYPVGKKRFEPLAVIFVACVMGTAALQVILESVQSIIAGPATPVVNAITISLIATVIVTKALLFVACRVVPSPSAQALAADHINDVVSNIVVLLALLVADHLTMYGDCIGAILVSLFIIVNWIQQGMEHVRNLAGHVAPQNLLQKATWIAVHHCDDILAVDTVRGYGFGSDCFLEVDIVLRPSMPLNIAHDIGESLQLRLEELDGVERAFVHLDYRTDHRASDEHRDNYVEGRHSTTLDYSHIPVHGPLLFVGAHSVACALSQDDLKDPKSC